MAALDESFWTRLAQAQGEFTSAPLDEENPHDRYRYASYASLIGAVRPALSKRGIAIVHSIEGAGTLEYGDDPTVCIRTRLVAADGEYDAGIIVLPVLGRTLRGGGHGDVDAQAYGASITYAKRYGLELALGIGREDDNSIDKQPQAQNQRRVDRDTGEVAGPRTNEDLAPPNSPVGKLQLRLQEMDVPWHLFLEYLNVVAIDEWLERGHTLGQAWNTYQVGVLREYLFRDHFIDWPEFLTFLGVETWEQYVEADGTVDSARERFEEDLERRQTGCITCNGFVEFLRVQCKKCSGGKDETGAPVEADGNAEDTAEISQGDAQERF